MSRDQPHITALRTAALDLAARGLTDRDIGAALRIDPMAVRELLAAPASEAAAAVADVWRRAPSTFHPSEVA